MSICLPLKVVWLPWTTPYPPSGQCLPHPDPPAECLTLLVGGGGWGPVQHWADFPLCANTGTPNVKERLLDLKGKLDCNSLIVGDLSTPLSPLHRSSGQEIGTKEIKDLKDTINHKDFTDIYRTFQLNITKYTFFLTPPPAPHWIFSRIDHIIGHKANLYRFKGREARSSIFSDHDGMKLELNFKRNTQNYSNTWQLNNLLLNDSTTAEELKTEIQRFMEAHDHEDRSFHNLWDAA